MRSANTATSTSRVTMARPKRAVLLRASRWAVWASSASDCTRCRMGRAMASEARTSWTMLLLRACGFMKASLLLVPILCAVADTWIEERVGQVNEKVDDDKTDASEQDKTLYLLIIPCNDGIDAVGAKAGDGKQDLHHNGPTNEEANLQAHKGHGRNEGIFQGVLENHRILRQAFGTRGGD